MIENSWKIVRLLLLIGLLFSLSFWEGRPPLPQEPVFILDEKFTGETVQSKYERLGE